MPVEEESSMNYYKNEVILYSTIFGMTLLVCLFITFFSYQKSIGNFGFLESLGSYVRSYASSGESLPEWITPLPRAIFFSSLSIAFFVVIMLLVSKLIIYLGSLRNHDTENEE
jgi:hypothetical protein